MAGISKTNVVIRALPPYVTMSVGNQYNNVRRAQWRSDHPRCLAGVHVSFGWVKTGISNWRDGIHSRQSTLNYKR